MRRFTLTLALVTIVAFAFGQRTTEINQFSKSDPNGSKKYISEIAEKTANIVAVWEYNFTDSDLVGTNGIPADFTYTPNSADVRDQWQWWGEGIIGRGYYADITIDETIETPTAVVPAEGFLFMNLAISYYWDVTTGADSLVIEYTTDGGTNWVRLFSNINQADVEAATVPWPYVSFTPYMYRIAIPAALTGQNISFRLKRQGTMGVSHYVRYLALGTLPDYDLETLGLVGINTYTASNDTDYFDGLYQLLPIRQKRNFEYFLGISQNSGKLGLTGINFSNKFIDAGGTIVAQKDTNFSIYGVQDFPNFLDKDTFECAVGFDPTDFANVTEGIYTFNSSMYPSETDEDSTNNEFSIDIEYVNSDYNVITWLARNTTITGRSGPMSYGGGASGDMFGMAFNVRDTVTILGGSVPLGSNTTANTGFSIKLFMWDTDLGSYVELANSDDYYCTAADAGTTVELDFLNSTVLYPGVDYNLMAVMNWTAGTSEISLGTYSTYPTIDYDSEGRNYYYTPAASLNIGGTWYFTSSIACVAAKLMYTTTDVNEISATENIKVYPNPTNGILHIDNVAGATVKVYNMLGAMVEVIDNANEFNTINLSNYAEGTYLVKVFTEEGVVVEKINVTK